MSDIEINTAPFYNEIAKRAIERLTPIAEQIAEQQLKHGYAPGTTPPTLAKLKKMDPAEAFGIITGMIRSIGMDETGRPIPPRTLAEGIKLFRQYMSWLEGQEARNAEPAGIA